MGIRSVIVIDAMSRRHRRIIIIIIIMMQVGAIARAEGKKHC
jgi:hypothetical protein